MHLTHLKYRQRKDQIGENSGLCHSDNTQALSKPVWNLCSNFDSDTVSTSNTVTLSVFH